MNGIVATSRCNFCTRSLPAWRVHKLAGEAQTICDDCLDWHNKAIALLAGKAIPGCQGCLASWEFLRDSSLGSRISLYVVPKDGIYQVLCAVCLRGYLPKRAELYRETAFGAAVNALPL